MIIYADENIERPIIMELFKMLSWIIRAALLSSGIILIIPTFLISPALAGENE